MSGKEQKAQLFRKSIFFSKIERIEDSIAVVHALPIGMFEHPWWGKFELSYSLLSAMVAHAQLYRERGGKLAQNFDHDYTRPAGEIVDLWMEGNGLWVKIRLNAKGKAALESGEYTRFSSEFADEEMEYKDELGRDYAPILTGGAFTNIPFFGITLDGVFLPGEEGDLQKVAARPMKTNQNSQKENKTMSDFNEKIKRLCGTENEDEQLARIEEWKANSEEAAEIKAEAEEAQEELEKSASRQSEFSKKLDSQEKVIASLTEKQYQSTLKNYFEDGKLDENLYKQLADPKTRKWFMTEKDLDERYAEAPRVIPKAIGSGGQAGEIPVNEAAKPGVDPESAKMDGEVRKIMKADNLSYGDAMIEYEKRQKRG